MSLSVSWGILKAHILDGKLVSDEGRKFPSIVLSSGVLNSSSIAAP